MREKFYTAHEAAEALGLEYHTFLARVRKDATKYPFVLWGASKVFSKDVIAAIKNEETRNASRRRSMA